MDAFLSCFACGKEDSAIVMPQKKSQIVELNTSNYKQLKTSPVQEIEDGKSRISMTTATFVTSETAPSKNGDHDNDIRNRLQVLRKKDLPERKAMEAEFVKQNLSKSKVIYLIEKRWSQEYTRFLKDYKIEKMRPINNQLLFDHKGQLKSNIKEKEDYFIITERVWKFVQALYGGGPAIERENNFPVIYLLNKRLEVRDLGMKNPLYLCYMISTFQFLLSVEQMNYYFYKKMFIENNENKKKPFSMAMHKLVSQVKEAKDIIKIEDYATLFQHRFSLTQQHDAHEFLIYLIEQLQEEGKVEGSEKILKVQYKDAESAYSAYFNCHKSFVDKAFAGQFETTVTCRSCQNKSITYSPFLQICLSINGDTIDECLKEHFQPEKLSDFYECEKCKNKTKAIKQSVITKTPNFLMFVLKKFTTSGKKIEDRISYQMKMDIKKYCKGHFGDSTYALHSLIIHKGSRSTKGHYYSFCRRHRQEWIYFNDENLKEIESKDALGRDPYILIYERQKSI